MSPRRRRAQQRAAQREARIRAREERARAKPSPPPAPTPRRERLPWAPVLWRAALVTIVALGVSANAVRNDFVYDDTRIIRGNPAVQGPLDPGAIFGSSSWGHVEAEDALYRPLTILSFALERQVFGPGPFPVHLNNVLLNAAVAVALFTFLIQLLPGRRLPLFAALLFAVQPIHAEVVANGVGRAELLAALLSLLAMIVHLRLVRGLRINRPEGAEATAPSAPAAAAGLGLAGLLFFAALLCKESAAVVPGLLFLAEWLVVERGRLRRMVPRIPIFVLYAIPLGISLLIRAQVVGMGTPSPPELLENVPGLERRLLASVTVLQQVAQMLVPHGFVPDYRDYSAPPSASLADPLALLSLLAGLGLAALVVWLWRRERFAPVFGIGWFALAILPTANLLFTIGTVRGDRLMYFPSAGLCLALAAGAVALSRFHRHLSAAALVAVLVWHGAAAIRQNAVWRDDLSLWTAAVEGNPGSAHAHRNLADALLDRNEDLDRATGLYERAVALREGAGFFYADARTQGAIALRRQGRLDAAEEQLRRVVEERPTHFVATMNLGQILNESDESRTEAIVLFEQAAALQPGNFHAHANLASALMRAGRLEEALAASDRAVSLNDRQRYVWSIRASILRRLDRPTEAAQATERARALR